MPIDGTPKCICAKRGVESFPTQGKVCSRIPTLSQAIWLKGTWGAYVSKKLMLLVAMAKLQKSINWAYVVFGNLHCKLWDLTTIIKLKKEDFGKETKFGGA